MKIEPIGFVKTVSDEEWVMEVLPQYGDGLHGIAAGDRLDVLYWMHNLPPGQRRVLKVHPRGDASRPLKGVFGLRSPMRPNPIGVSAVRVLRLEPGRLFVTPFDAQDGSPVVDIKAGRSTEA